MPRKARIDTPGALHHIIIRGIERIVILGRPLKGVSRKKIPPHRKNMLFFLYT